MPKTGVLRALRTLDAIIREFERYVLIAAIILGAGVLAFMVIRKRKGGPAVASVPKEEPAI